MTGPRSSFVLAAIIGLAGPVRAQCPDGTPPPCAGATRAVRRATDPNGIVVLYLGSLAGDSAGSAIADGLTEEIIARLSQVTGLHPASRYASLRYRGRRAVDPRLVGRELAARYVLDGSVRRSADRLRVVLTMTDANAGFNVWGRTFERPLAEIFSIEDSVAVQVAEAVVGHLSSGERGRLAPALAPTNVEAYQAFLRGRVAIRSRTAAAATEAVTDYRRALALDPGFARAWAGLAHALSLSRDWGWSLRGVAADSIQALAEQAAARALALDSADSECWMAAAMAERGRDMREALRLHRRAAAMDSTSVEAVHQLAWGYFGVGELDSAMLLERRVIVRDPYFAYAYAGLAEMLNVGGRPEEALAVVAQGETVDSSNAPLYWQLGDALAHTGREVEAERAADRALALGFDAVGARVLRAIAELRAGDTVGVRAQLPDLERAVGGNSMRAGGLAYTVAGELSGLYAQLGNVERSVFWAQQVALWPRHLQAVRFARHWYWEPVRADPRFQSFLATLRL